MDIVTFALLKKKIELLSSVGKFLSLWNCETGLPVTNPSSSLPYTYTTGDYYRVSSVDNASQYAEYDSTQTYNVGDKCSYESAYYVCNTASTTGEWDATKWTAHTIKNYKPDGTSYSGSASTVEEAQGVMVEDIYIFDGSVWTLLPHLKLADYYTSEQCDEKFTTVITTEPTADNTTKAPIFVYLASEPATKYNGYIYLIKE